MRHLGSVVLALVAAPLALLLAGRGLVGLAETAPAVPTDYFGLVAAGSALVLAGLLFALLTMVRLAPLGPALAGAGYLAVGAWALADPAGFRARLPSDLPGFGEEQLASAATVAPLLAVPLLVTLFIPARWRRPAVATPVPGAGTMYGRPARHTLDDVPAVPAGPPAPPSAPPAAAPPHPPPPPPSPAPPPAPPSPPPVPVPELQPVPAPASDEITVSLEAGETTADVTGDEPTAPFNTPGPKSTGE